MQQLYKKLVEATEAKVLRDETLSKYTTFKIGGPADIFFIPSSIKDLENGLKIIAEAKAPYFIMGNGSNLLISDQGFNGVVIRLAGNINDIKYSENGVTAGTGAFIKQLIYSSAEKGLSGFEYFIGIPAAVGGALSMNMGGWVNNLGDLVKHVGVIRKGGKIKKLSKNECGFTYRSSALKENRDIIISAEFELAKEESGKILERAEGLLKLKGMSQPVGHKCAGCIFKNPSPEKISAANIGMKGIVSAGRLIEKANLKGESIGGAVVSDIHANFIVNTNGARASDVMSLINRVKGIVFEKFGIELELEVELVGF